MKNIFYGVIAFMISATFPAQAGVYQASVTFFVKAGRAEEFKAAVAKVLAPTRREPGCLGYRAFQVLDEQGRETNQFEFTEVWSSQATMMIDHKERTAHMQAFFQTVNLGHPDSLAESFVIEGHNVNEL
jgi:quinol monooxygenase YgiN